MRNRLAYNTIARTRALRNSRTDAEGLLWWKLREWNKRGFHFRRQVPFRGYILDFAEHKTHLVIELDGSQHGFSEHRARDIVRDAVLAKQGYLVLRFANGEVLKELDRVVDVIIREAERRRPPPGLLRNPTSPQGGGDHSDSPPISP
ncbi:MAG TPA: DUF559 domain-containing protein [Rhizomicrobium sp.]|nr:DUF559 domain-containing protein [Rhizomicrobium sp.]